MSLLDILKNIFCCCSLESAEQNLIPSSHTPLIGASNGDEQNMHGGGDGGCNSPTRPSSYGYLHAALQPSTEGALLISESVYIPPQTSSSSLSQGKDKNKDLSLDQMSSNTVTSGASPSSPGFDLGFGTLEKTTYSGTPEKTTYSDTSGSAHSSPGFALGLGTLKQTNNLDTSGSVHSSSGRGTPRQTNNSDTSGSAHSSPGFGLGLLEDDDFLDAGSTSYSSLKF